MIDWANSNNIEAMLQSLPDGAFHSELRLFAVACASRVLHILPEPEFASALDTSQRFAAGDCGTDELQQRVDAASALLNPHFDFPTVRDFAGSAVIDASSVYMSNSKNIAASATCALQAVACAAANEASDDEYDLVYDATIDSESKLQCDLLRSQIPNPNLGIAT